VHPHPDPILPPRDGRVDEGSRDAPPGLVRIVRDGSAATASCPHCGGRLELSTIGTRWHVRHPADVADRLVAQLGGLEREQLVVLVLNTKCAVVAEQVLYVGNISTVLVRVGELFSEAVQRNAGGVILVHNHPSGDVTPSPDDLHLTAQAIAAGRLLDIPVLDHIVIAGSTYISLRERGVAFDSPGDQERLRRSATSEDPASRRGGPRSMNPGGAQ
jgi:DNA repair protein RadC